MRRAYTGLKAERIDFGSYNMVTYFSVPKGCYTIVADLQDGSTCTNPDGTQQVFWQADHPNYPPVGPVEP